jgi:hypothetical protein
MAGTVDVVVTRATTAGAVEVVVARHHAGPSTS